MLCRICDSITLDLCNETTDVEIRRYSSLAELCSIAAGCDFCSLLYGAAKTIEDPNEGQYCKETWGIEFFNQLLQQSPVIIHHRSRQGEHNVLVRCYLDAKNTRGYEGGPIALNWREMLGGICVGPDSDMAKAVAGRPFSSHLSGDEQIAIAKARYDECQLTHSQCKDCIDPTFMPRRVLDLAPESLQDGLIQLLTVPYGFKVPYATLSYCWGNAQNLRLTTDVLPEFSEKGVLLSRLPATIRDACEVCTSLSIRYLWVCSLCIIQDSEQDWLQQSCMMGTVYNCSSLTLSASSGLDCSAGLFGERPNKTVHLAKLECVGLDGVHGTCYVRGRIAPHGFKEPTELRGWTLQESLLSRRLLTWGTFQMSWQCATLRWSQSGRVLEPLRDMQRIFPCPPLRYPLNLYDDNKSLEQIEHRSISKIWQDLVEEYSGRNLSVSGDKLPAISGLAKWLSRHLSTKERYLAGLWWSQLPESLLWYNNLVFPADEDQAIRPQSYRAPSWTWASLDSKYLQWLDTTSHHASAKVLACDISYKDDDTFGEVLDGHLSIETSIKEGWLVPSRTHPEHFDFWGEDWVAELTDPRHTILNKSLGSAYIDLYDTNDLAVVRLVGPKDRAWACECLRITTHAGLLVCSPGEREQYDPNLSSKWRQRIGVVSFKDDRITEWWRDASNEIIHLI